MLGTPAKIFQNLSSPQIAAFLSRVGHGDKAAANKLFADRPFTAQKYCYENIRLECAA